MQIVTREDVETAKRHGYAEVREDGEVWMLRAEAGVGTTWGPIAVHGEAIGTDAYGEWACLCGNSPSAAGFYPCDSEGETVEPSLGDGWAAPLYRCDRCGRIIRDEGEGKAGLVVGAVDLDMIETRS